MTAVDYANLGPSLVRILAAAAVGGAGTDGLLTYVHSTPAQATPFITGGLIWGYYTLVRLAEHRWPGLGRLLVIAQAPTYSPGTPPGVPAGAWAAQPAAPAVSAAPSPLPAPAAPTLGAVATPPDAWGPPVTDFSALVTPPAPPAVP